MMRYVTIGEPCQARGQRPPASGRELGEQNSKAAPDGACGRASRSVIVCEVRTSVAASVASLDRSAAISLSCLACAAAMSAASLALAAAVASASFDTVS